MKNTMKMKSLLSFFVPAAMMSLMVAGCSDYDNGYDTNAIKFAQEFRKTFGDIDPEQDWNLAERGTVTVSTMKESEVKIYALTGDEYTIVGDYQGVKGTQMLGFDMVEGTKSILVTDGETAQKTVPGGVVAFGSTRTTYGGNDVVKIDKIENENGLYLETTGKTYRKYVEFKSMDDYSKIFETVPEIGFRDPRNKTNLNKVPSNFHYTSNGSFIIYPIFWNTSSLNTLGVYYKNGDEIVKVPVYKHKEGNEVQYVGNLRKDADWSNHYETNGHFDTKDKILSWTESNYNQVGDLGFDGNLISQGYKYLTINAEMLESTTQYRIYFRDKKNSDNQHIVSVNQSGSYTIDLSTVPNDIVTNCTILISGGGNSQTGSVKVNSMYLWSDVVALHNFEGTDEAHFRCDAIFEQGDGKFNGQKILAQGIKVDIQEGTVFGMYLEKTENAGTANAKTYTFYSESELNNPESDTSKGVVGVGYGVIDDDNGRVTEVTDLNNPKSHPCYASAFDVDGLQYLGFEDWPNIYNNSDFDLNDMLFAFDGCKPTIINEEPDKWLLACEDLGGSFDIDYNDVVFAVEHISGQNKAKLTPLAAGGTLASYIYFQDPLSTTGNRNKLFGEIHQLFGAEPVKSGEFEIVNARHRFEKTAQTIEFDVDENWTLAYYSTGETGGTNYGGAVNMGGFEIRTLKSGEEAPLNFDLNDAKFSGASKIQPSTLDRGDNVPYILCLPYSYKHFNYNRATPEAGKKTVCVWAWPTEFTTICNVDGTSGPYKDFAGWVQNHNNNTDWYKNKDYHADAATVDNLFLSVSNMTQAEISGNSGNNGGNGGNNQQQNTGTGDAGFGIQAAIASDQTFGNVRGTGNWRDTGDHTVYLLDGQTLTLSPYSNTDAEGAITVSAFSNGGTQTTINKSVGSTIASDGVTITAHANQSGIASITLHFAGDSKYAPKDITYTIQIIHATVNRIQVSSSTVGTVDSYYLNKQDATTLVLNKDYGQPWVFEEVPGESGYYRIYNLNNNQYLSATENVTGNTGKLYRPAFSSAIPGDLGKFTISGGKIKCKASEYLGNDANGSVWLDKDNYVTWQLVSPN